MDAVEPHHVVLADMEAGIGTMTRLKENAVDYVLIVAEASAKSLEVARRAVLLARENKVGRVIVLANRVRDDDDLDLIRQTLGDEEYLIIPEDRAIQDADRDGLAPMDAAPDAPAVIAIRKIVDRLALPT